MTLTLEAFVRAAHPRQTVEPLDATTPSDLAMVGPTVIIEVDGAREALDALVRVRRLVIDAPMAAVRLSAVDDTPEPSRRSAFLAAFSGLVAVVSAIFAGVRLMRDVPGGGLATGMLLALALLLALIAGRSWFRARRLPTRRRRYRERHRSSGIIAVTAPDESAAATLAARVRRALADTSPAGMVCEVSVHRVGQRPDRPSERGSD